MGRVHCRILFAAISLPGLAANPARAESEPQDRPRPNPESEQIVVMGDRPGDAFLAGLIAEAELDEAGIASYGHDSLGQLMGEITRLAGTTEDGPVILINGQPSTGLSAIADLPTEAVRKVQLLSREAATRLGERPSRRVVNIEIKPDHRQATTSTAAALATAGKGFSGQAELNLLRLANGNRTSLVLTGRHVDPLFESDRPIANDPLALPYDLRGTIIADPAFAPEIDPALSALVAVPVAIAPVPDGLAIPALADFAALAGLDRQRVPRRARSLIGRQQNLTLNANLTRALGRASSFSLNLQAGLGRSAGTTSAQAASFRLPAGSPFTPFTRDVLLARYFGEPLRSRSEDANLSLAALFNTRAGAWRLSAGGLLLHRASDSFNERGYDAAAYQAGLNAGTIDPFALDDAAQIGPAQRDVQRVRGEQGQLYATLAGSPLRLPSGPLNLVLRAEWKADRFTTSFGSGGSVQSRRFSRNEALLQASLNAPLLGGRQRASAIGSLDFELSASLRRVTASGSLGAYAGALNWRPDPAFSLRLATSRDQFAPPANLLTDPVIVTEAVRTYDFIRQETVLVSQTSGGNPQLGVETRRSTSLSATLIPLASPDLVLDAEYSSTTNRNAYGSILAVNADVQAAFPDRFGRDGDGRLVAVDIRPVPYARLDRSQLRWGFTFTRTVRTAAAAPGGPTGDGGGGGSDALVAGLRFNAFAAHTWTLSSRQLARVGLPETDVLATGVGGQGSLTRHIVQLGGGIAYRGAGLQLSGFVFGPRHVAAGSPGAPERIDYAARATIDLRLFANFGPLFPASDAAKNARITLEVANLFDSRQLVTDRLGQTPLSYQPYLIDALGRKISLRLRKVF
jgi:hypothetical protein